MIYPQEIGSTVIASILFYISKQTGSSTELEVSFHSMAFLKSQGLRKSQDCSFNNIFFTPFKDIKRVTCPLRFIISPVPDTGKVLCTACGSLRPQPPPSVTEWENPGCTSCGVCGWFCPRLKGKHHTLSTLVPGSEKKWEPKPSVTQKNQCEAAPARKYRFELSQRDGVSNPCPAPASQVDP